MSCCITWDYRLLNGSTPYRLLYLHIDHMWVWSLDHYVFLRTIWYMVFMLWLISKLWYDLFKVFFHIDSLRCALMSISLLSLPIQPLHLVFGLATFWVESTVHWILRCAWICISLLIWTVNVVWPLSKLNELSMLNMFHEFEVYWNW